MPRLNPISKRVQVSGDGLKAFDAIIESRGSINAPQSMHMYVPEIARCSLLVDLASVTDMATLSIPLASILSSFSMTSMPVPVPVSDLAKAACGH